MWRLEKRFTFEASHQLPQHVGKCQRLHGHSWRGALVLEGDALQESGSETGMLMDYQSVSQVLEPLLETALDHRHLNETTGLRNPTSEEIARWIYRRLKPVLPLLIIVRVEETCTCSCEYSE